VAFAHGELMLEGAAPVYPPAVLRAVSDYPPGTSLLQTPFVLVAGWRAAAALSVLSLIIATLVTSTWLREIGYDPRFAVLIPGFFGAMFFGRVAMSDVPSAAIVAIALWLLWRADGRGWRWSFFAGLAAGLSLLFREPNVVLLAPLFLGAIIRRKCVPWAIVLGGLVGIATRAGLSYEMFGSATYVRTFYVGFALRSVWTNLPQYAVDLLVMFPLGALLPFSYRGPRRPEVVTAFLLFTAVFLFYDHDSARENGRIKGIILTSRYVIPSLPLLTLMAAEVFPRWFARVPAPVAAAMRRGRPALLVAFAIACFAIHVAVHRQERTPLSIVRAIQTHTSPAVPVITNQNATLKYLSPVYGARRKIVRADITASDVPRFYRQYGQLGIVFLDRSDSEAFREDVRTNERFLFDLQSRCAFEQIYDGKHGASARLRVFSITRCG
jgi:4-amino-4-deoxy-L-arabinose transferase-like glycosyltransferase